MSDQQLEEEAENLLLQEFSDIRLRLQKMEAGELGYYAPTDLDEQRRAWVFELMINSEFFFEIDNQLRAMHKAAEWLKTGRKPIKTKALDTGEEAVVLQLVKDQS